MVYRAEFDCEYDWLIPEQQASAVVEAVAKLRRMADDLDRLQMDDILTNYPKGNGIQGWWAQ